MGLVQTLLERRSNLERTCIAAGVAAWCVAYGVLCVAMTFLFITWSTLKASESKLASTPSPVISDGEFTGPAALVQLARLQLAVKHIPIVGGFLFGFPMSAFLLVAIFASGLGGVVRVFIACSQDKRSLLFDLKWCLMYPLLSSFIGVFMCVLSFGLPAALQGGQAGPPDPFVLVLLSGSSGLLQEEVLEFLQSRIRGILKGA